MALTSGEIAALVKECGPAIEGASVDNVHQNDAHTVYLTLHSRGYGKLSFLFSTRPRLSRFHLVPLRPPAPPEPLSFCEAARKALKGTAVEGLRQVSGGRVVEMSFTRRVPAAGGAEKSSLVLEMLGGRGRLFLVRGDRKIISTLPPAKVHEAQAQVAGLYRFPEIRQEAGQLKGLGPHPWRYLVDATPENDLDAPFPLHFAVARHYAASEEEAIVKEKRQALGSHLRKEARRRDEILEKVQEDLLRAEAGEEWLRKGELLKGALGRLRRGMGEAELDDYFDPSLPKIRIELDPALTPRENVERCFRRYQKSRRAIPFLKERRAKIAAERDRLRDLLARLEGAERIQDLDAIELDVRQAAPRREARRAKGAAAGEALGPRRFRSQDGFELFAGRNAKQNDALTLRIGRGNDIFIHVAGRPGAHVLVRSIPGKTVPLETLLDAAHLAFYYSLPERARGEMSAGASADVDYTPVKHVRKPRGARPGLVFLVTHKTLRIRFDPDRLDRVRRTSKE